MKRQLLFAGVVVVCVAAAAALAMFGGPQEADPDALVAGRTPAPGTAEGSPGSRAAERPPGSGATAGRAPMGGGDATGTSPSTLPQLLRTNERAHITAAIAGHDPMARGTTVRLAVEVEVLPGMHVNANPPSEEWLIPVQASVAGVEGIQVLEAFYPEAESRKFPYAEEPFLVYEGTFVIGLLLSLDDGMPPGGRELEVVLDYQACNDEACFAPAATSVKLPVMVVADRADAKPVSSSLLSRAPFPN